MATKKKDTDVPAMGTGLLERARKALEGRQKQIDKQVEDAQKPKQDKKKK